MSVSQIPDENLTEIYSSLHTLLQTLQIQSMILSFTQQSTSIIPSFHNHFLAPLPDLLTPRKAHAFYKLRMAYIHVTYLSSFAERSVKTRYINFGRAILWAVDHADHLIHSVGQASELEIMKAIRTIIHLVASLCYREWGIENASLSHPDQVVNTSQHVSVPSIQDPVYHPQPRIRSSSASHSDIVGNASERANYGTRIEDNLHSDVHTTSLDTTYNRIDDGTQIGSRQLSSNRFCLNQFIQTSENANDAQENIIREQNENAKQSCIPFNNSDKSMESAIPGAYIKEIADGCHVPFELFLQKNREDEFNGILGVLNVGVLYPDNTCFPYIPVQDVHLLKHRAPERFLELQHPFVTVDVSTEVYRTIISRLKNAYMERFPSAPHVFLANTGPQQAMINRRMEIKIPVLTDCFARVVHRSSFVELPLWEALQMCQRDLLGSGLLKAEFMEVAEGTKIVISLAGFIVEKNFLNCIERIFEL